MITTVFKSILFGLFLVMWLQMAALVVILLLGGERLDAALCFTILLWTSWAAYAVRPWHDKEKA